MNKLLKILVLSLVTLMVFGCSNDDKKKRSGATGSVIFYSSINGTDINDQLDLDGDDRNFGDINYDTFEEVFNIPVGNQNLEVVNPASDPDDNETLLETTFKVEESDRLIYALTNRPASSTAYDIHQIRMAEDTEIDSDDTDNIFLNIAHVNPEEGQLTVHFLPDGSASPSSGTLVATLSYGDVVDLTPINSSTGKIEKRIYIENTSGVVFDTEEELVTINDNFRQTLLITDFVSNQGGNITSVYYIQNGIAPSSSISTSGKGAIRFVNYMDFAPDDDSTAGTIEINLLDSDSNNVLLQDDIALAYGEKTLYNQIDTGTYRLEVNVTAPGGVTVANYPFVQVAADKVKTIFLHGELPANNIITNNIADFSDNKKVVGGDKVRATFTNFIYTEVDDVQVSQSLDFEVVSSEAVTLVAYAGRKSDTIDISTFGTSQKINALLSVDGTELILDGGPLYLTSGDDNLFAAGETRDFAIRGPEVKVGGRPKLEDITEYPVATGAAGDGGSTVVVDNDTPTVNNPVTVTITVKDTDGEIRDSGGDVVTVFVELVSGGASSAALTGDSAIDAQTVYAVDGLDGTYTIDIDDAVSEDIIATVTVNGFELTETVTISYQP